MKEYYQNETRENSLKIKTIIYCNICGCSMKRTKTIKVSSQSREEAIEEAESKIKSWRKSLKNQNCKVCSLILENV